MRFVRNIAVILACAMPLAGCAEEKKNGLATEMAARKLAAQASTLEQSGKHEEAADIYTKLAAEYAETKFYKEELEPEMARKGITMEETLVSKTIHTLYEFQNSLVNYKNAKGFYPDGAAMKVPKDVWGNLLIYKKADKEGAKYEFFVISKGPDGKLKTDDDLYLVYAGGKSDAAKFGDAAGVKRPLKPKKKLQPGVVSLEDLEKQAATGSVPAGEAPPEKRVSVDELAGETGTEEAPARNVTGDEEVVKSLDDLL